MASTTGVLERTACDIAGRQVVVVDSATAMADAARQILEGAPAGVSPGQGELHCYVTDASRLQELAPRFLGEPLSGFDLVDL